MFTFPKEAKWLQPVGPTFMASSSQPAALLMRMASTSSPARTAAANARYFSARAQLAREPRMPLSKTGAMTSCTVICWPLLPYSTSPAQSPITTMFSASTECGFRPRASICAPTRCCVPYPVLRITPTSSYRAGRWRPPAGNELDGFEAFPNGASVHASRDLGGCANVLTTRCELKRTERRRVLS